TRSPATRQGRQSGRSNRYKSAFHTVTHHPDELPRAWLERPGSGYRHGQALIAYHCESIETPESKGCDTVVGGCIFACFVAAFSFCRSTTLRMKNPISTTIPVKNNHFIIVGTIFLKRVANTREIAMAE